ncbi:MAG TPA: cytidylate kinase-like family protein [Ruminococcaceae bacterium]|nr:cytidylate kinase-like family protein [Oscillospiraceae bacterium]HCK49774.1 cytidylate kinase-like family protein [Oscillospiraceae bacterium]
MGKQLIITVGREFGSGGHIIAVKLAEHFGIQLLDSNILAEVAKKSNAREEYLKKYDESARNLFFSRTVNGFSNSPEEIIAQMQFDYIKQKSDAGESFVVIGRCADYILRENPALVRVFVLGDTEAKIKRTAEREGISEDKAKIRMEQADKRRKYFHNTHSENKWGDSRSYDITVNSSKLGLDSTAELLIKYIELRNAE